MPSFAFFYRVLEQEEKAKKKKKAEKTKIDLPVNKLESFSLR